MGGVVMKENLINEHKNDYKDLKRKQLVAILDEFYREREEHSSRMKGYYDPIKSTKNNAKRSIRKQWKNRHDITARYRIKAQLKKLKDFRDEGR